MNVSRSLVAIPLFLSLQAAALTVTVESVTYNPGFRGACDASAAAWVEDGKTFVAATDEMDSDQVNRLHVYRVNATKKIGEVLLTPAIGAPLPMATKPEDRESDLEGAARIGTRIFWIASHGASSKANPRPDRRRFFATDVDASGKVKLAGDPNIRLAYAKLVEDLSADPKLSSLKIAETAKLAPEKGGLNIEGLAATKDEQLLIGFRSPLDSKGKAFVVPLLNGPDLIAGTAPAATFGKPKSLDLGKRGIRDLTYWRERDVYLILAGAPDDGQNFALFSWRGGTDTPVLVPVRFDGLHPESMLLDAKSENLILLSDDGDEAVERDANGKADPENKDAPTDSRFFRAITLKLKVK